LTSSSETLDSAGLSQFFERFFGFGKGPRNPAATYADLELTLQDVLKGVSKEVFNHYTSNM
jgi:hypothetical protein